MGLASTLFGSRLRIALVGLLVVVGTVGGAYAAGLVGAPSVQGVDNRFAGVNDSATVIETDVRVRNPNFFSANLSGLSVSYAVEMNDLRMATGERDGVAIGAGTTAVPLRTSLDNGEIPAWWVSHVRNGEHTTLRVDATVNSSTLGRSFEAPPVTRSVDTDLLGAFNSTEPRPINADKPVVSDPVLYVNETRAQWGTVTDDRTALNLTFVVHNPKSYPVVVSKLGYDISMNDVDVGEGETESGYAIPAHSTKTIRATTYIQNDRLDDWWVTHIERNQTTDLRIDFSAELEAAGSTFTVPLDPLTYEKTFETDIFGTKADAGGGAGSGSGGGSTDGTATTAAADTTTTSGGEADTTAAGSDATASPSATDSGTPTESAATPTPTATPTTTDDGGLLS